MSTSLTIFCRNIFYSRINLEKFYFSKESTPIGFLGDVFFFIFDFDLVGKFLHGRPITIANSRSENLIGLPANLNQASYFLLTFRCLEIKYFANFLIKAVYRLFPESCQMKRLV